MPIVFAFHHILAKLNLSHMVDDESKLHIGECKVECPDLEAVLVESLDGDGGP